MPKYLHTLPAPWLMARNKDNIYISHERLSLDLSKIEVRFRSRIDFKAAGIGYPFKVFSPTSPWHGMVGHITSVLYNEAKESVGAILIFPSGYMVEFNQYELTFT